ncbi:methyltransferase domain-containing protein [Asaia sp. BMEF1]|uniref:class I SAM-dependent methyltransferase n=1 Tax=Asaia sp. BMEF1 TaxID=3155932 RepID=UPI003F67AE3E
MGEIFQRTMPEAELEFTGERFTTSASGQIEIEHLHRYFIARALSREKDVLDIASGEGYGTALIAQVARTVTGVEVSEDAVSHAQQTYRNTNLKYLLGDARKIPLPDSSIDLVVSFETIEHFYEHEQFISEVKRVLRPDGVFLVSSPQRDVYSPPGSAANPYHVRELSRSSFTALLKGSFVNVKMMGQRPLVGSVVFPEGEKAQNTMVFERRGSGHFEASDDLPRALYDIAIASNQSLPNAPVSAYIDREDVGLILSKAEGFSQALSEIDRLLERAVAAEKANGDSRLEIASSITQAQQQASTYQEQINQAHETIRHLTAEIETASASHAALEVLLETANNELIFKTNLLEKLNSNISQEREIAINAQNEANIAANQRDKARVVAQRSAAIAERYWRSQADELRNRLSQTESDKCHLRSETDELRRHLIQTESDKRTAEEQFALWHANYHRLRDLLERSLRASGIYFVSRIVPRPVRRGIIRLLRGATGR